MDYLLNFLEEMDELVYISDPKTYEIFFMNRKLRESLGIRDPSECAGLKCHKVLQGYDAPCSFCTNGALQVGKVISWTHKNPVLNKRYLIKDTLLEYCGKVYRVEIAIDVDAEVVCNTPYYYARSESILNECLQQVVSAADPEESLDKVLAFLGKTFLCDRAYVFEFDGAIANNTYEWTRDGITPQKEILQDLSLSSLDWWIQLFRKNDVVAIPDLEEIRLRYPTTYAILKPQDISSLAAGPISIDGNVVGFLGVDNPSADLLTLLTPLLKVIGYFIASLIKRRDLLRHLNVLSFRDTLTGAFNRNAMFEHSGQLLHVGSVGVVYCDVTGLKQTNDTQGHSAGDQLIQHCYQLIDDALDTPWVYRAGGDEFVAVLRNCTQSEFSEKVEALCTRIQQDAHHIAVGYAWSDQQPFRLEALISQADQIMYQDKRDYYSANPGMAQTARDARAMLERGQDGHPSLFTHFLDTTYYDMELLFQSITQQNTSGYFFFGDMQKDLFFISDNMRDEFGFESNIVPGLLQAWSQRIASDKERDLYWSELNSMLEDKRSVHDLRYQVRDAGGRIMWIHCYGILKWDETQQVPLFYSGRVTHQDNAFVVDPITNFPRESVLFSRLDEIKSNRQTALVIGFSFNHIAEINSTRGRSHTDYLVRNIAEELVEKIADKMFFYRLDGMRCAAIVDPGCRESKASLVQEVRSVVSECYHHMGISVQQACSIALMEFPQAQLTPMDFLDQLVSLLRIAKHEPGQPFVEYSEISLEKVRKMSNMALALNRDVLHHMDHFRIVVQPVVSAKTGAILGGEALLRWTCDGEDVPPAVFVPMLEKEHMIQLAGRWVFEQTVCTCMRLIAHFPSFYLTFNVSLHQMTDAHFPEFMEKTLAKYQLSGSHLVAEMTESFMDEQPEKLINFVNVCNRMGIRIALDDFGSGYSSLRMLLQYPSSIIKLDRSLLCEMVESEDKKNFISSIVYACHRFGKKVCMEGVETAEQNRLIQEAGCDMIQGYYYYRPMEIDDVYRLLASKKRRA